MRASRLCSSILAALAASIVLAAGSAQGFVTSGRPWPGGVITYYNAAADQAWAVQAAVAAWNASGVHIEFVPTSADRAQVRIEHFTNTRCTINAEASVGYTRDARVFVSQLDQRSPYCNAYAGAQMMAHELGHVLGLGHETHGCATMNPSTTLQGPALCPKGAPWQWRCRLLTPDDIAGAVALYGGTVRPQRGPRDCDIYTASSPPAGLALAPTGVPGEERLSFRRPPSVGIPVLLAALHEQPESFGVKVTAGRCATEVAGASRYRWDVQSGELEQLPISLPAGSQCISVWAVDAFDRPSSKPATVWSTGS